MNDFSFHKSLDEHIHEIDLNVKIPVHLRNAAFYIEDILFKNGFEGYLVGGSVRDLFLGRKIADLDYTSNARPEDIKKIFPRVIPVGEKFGTLIVLYKKLPIEITTYRREGKYIDGRRPHHIRFGDKLEEDVHRRDFTINGLAYSVRNRTLLDYVGGLKDLQSKTIKTIGDPLERFQEDGLRPIRGCRIMANLHFQMDPKTMEAMVAKLDVVSKIAPERFFDEWRKTLKIQSKDTYWRILKKTGIFKLFFSEFKNLNNNDTTWEELLYAIQHSMPGNMGVYAAHFFYFELHRANVLPLEKNSESQELIRRFFLTNRFPKHIERLCRELVFSPLLDVFDKTLQALNQAENSKTSNGLTNLEFEKIVQEQIEPVLLKKALSQIDRENWFNHLRFCKEVIISKLRREHKENIYPRLAQKAIRQIRRFIAGREPIYIKDIALNGDDLKALGITGRDIGEKLSALQMLVIEEPGRNNKESLTAYIRSSS